MKRWGALVAILLIGATALVLSEKRKPGTPVGPATILHWIAGIEREVTRVPASVSRLSDEDEVKIGDAMASNQFMVPTGEQSAPDRTVMAYVERVGQRVAAHAHRKLPYRFHYVPNSDFINAFALPGGHVFIGAGLIALMDSEDELATVLGHETEHIDHYHCAERVQVEARLRMIPLGGLVALPIEIFEAGYSKEQELEADREGTRLAVWASYSPLGAIRMFETFDWLYQKHVTRARTPQEELSRVALETLKGYFQSHPPPPERIEQIRRLITTDHWENLVNERPLEVAEVFRAARAQRLRRGGH